MVLIDHIDGPNRDIYLDISTMNTDIHPIDIYKEMRTLRANNEELRKYNLFLEAGGNITKTPTTSTERYVIELDGTRIIPYDASHVLTITGTIITDSGLSGVDCFDRTSLSPTTVVDINYVPPQVEIITVAGGADWTDTEKTQIRDSLGVDGTKATATGGQLQDVLIDTTFLRNEAGGRWRIVANQMIFYKEDDTELMRFDLFDGAGAPTMTNVMRRERVP